MDKSEYNTLIIAPILVIAVVFMLLAIMVCGIGDLSDLNDPSP